MSEVLGGILIEFPEALDEILMEVSEVLGGILTDVSGVFDRILSLERVAQIATVSEIHQFFFDNFSMKKKFFWDINVSNLLSIKGHKQSNHTQALYERKQFRPIDECSCRLCTKYRHGNRDCDHVHS